MMFSSGLAVPFKTAITLCDMAYFNWLVMPTETFIFRGMALKVLLRASARISPLMPAEENIFLATESVIQPSTWQRDLCLSACCKNNLAPVLLVLITDQP